MFVFNLGKSQYPEFPELRIKRHQMASSGTQYILVSECFFVEIVNPALCSNFIVDQTGNTARIFDVFGRLESYW